MPTPKVILFYGFTPLADPDAIRLWQHTLCDSLGIRGRIIVSRDGINGTLGGDVVQLKKYVKGTRSYAPFKDLDVKWSEGRAREDGSTADFPRLSVRVRDELVTFGVPDELHVDESGVIDGGTHLTPAQLHELVADRETREPLPAATMGRIKSDLIARNLIPFIMENRIHVVPPCVVTPDEVAEAISIYDDVLGSL